MKISPYIELKVELQKLIFPMGIVYYHKENVYRTEKINPIFNFFSSLAGGLGGNENRTFQSFDEKSCYVPGTGLEPVRP